jgi:hypothetical protein
MFTFNISDKPKIDNYLSQMLYVNIKLLNILMTIGRTSGPGSIFPLAYPKKTEKFKTTFSTISSFVEMSHSTDKLLISQSTPLWVIISAFGLYSFHDVSLILWTKFLPPFPSYPCPPCVAISSSQPHSEGGEMLGDLLRDFAFLSYPCPPCVAISSSQPHRSVERRVG